MTRNRLALAVFLLAGCGALVVQPRLPVGELSISVHGQEFLPIEGARVFFYTGGEPIILGATDVNGFVSVQRSILVRHRHGVIVACAHGYFCGALPLDRQLGGYDLVQFDEMHVGLQVGFVK